MFRSWLRKPLNKISMWAGAVGCGLFFVGMFKSIESSHASTESEIWGPGTFGLGIASAAMVLMYLTRTKDEPEQH